MSFVRSVPTIPNRSTFVSAVGPWPPSTLITTPAASGVATPISWRFSALRSSTVGRRQPPRPRPPSEAGQEEREELLKPGEGRCRDNPTLEEGGEEEEEGAGAAEGARAEEEVGGDEEGPVEALEEAMTAGMRVTPARELSHRRRRLSAATVGWRL